MIKRIWVVDKKCFKVSLDQKKKLKGLTTKEWSFVKERAINCQIDSSGPENF